MTTSEFIPTENKRRESQSFAPHSKRRFARITRQIAQHTKQARLQANSPPTPNHTERWAPPRLNAHTTNRNRKPGELPVGIPKPRNDGSPPKLDAGTVGRRANSSPAYRHRGTMGPPPKLDAGTVGRQANSSLAYRHRGTMGLPQSSTRGQSDAGRTPRRHTDTAERWVSPKARRAHDKHEIGRQAISSPAFRRRGTMGLPHSSTRARPVLGPAPANSPPAHRPSGAAGLPAPLTPHYKE